MNAINKNILSYLACILFTTLCQATDFLDTQGHIKFQQQYFSSDQDSLDSFLGPPKSSQTLIDFRAIKELQLKQWSLIGHYQVNSISGSAVKTNTQKNSLLESFNTQITSPLLNLSNNIKQQNRHIIKQKLDRLYLSYTHNQLAVKIGRQALSWGNGLIFRPMDIFNPFSPNEVDNSYKSGIDMFYAQWLFINGSDISFLMAPRRSFTSQNISAELSSSAIKWHGFYNNIQADFLLAKDYNNTIVATGINGPINDAIWRADLVQTILASNEKKLSVVFNIETAWQWHKKNLSGFIEYFHNGIGQKNTAYTLNNLATELQQSLSRGQLFNTGENYLAYGARISWTPLLQLSPLLMSNINDHSHLLFIQGLYSYTQNVRIDFGASLKHGKKGTEFGGIETSPNSGIYLQIANQLYARLSYYF